MFNLNGAKALITGASGGIGSAISRALHSAGAHIIASGSDLKKLEVLVTQFEGRINTLKCDLSDQKEASELFTLAEEQFGQIDILICNAGICRDNLSVRMRAAEWDDVIQLNLTSTFKINQAACAKMMRRKYGRIINISSIIGYIGNAGQANYSASKAGMIAMSKSLAIEMATRNITVNCIAPGFIDTAMTESMNQKVKDMIISRIPMQRMGLPNEIASAALFLASEEAAYITGQTIHINGGMLML